MMTGGTLPPGWGAGTGGPIGRGTVDIRSRPSSASSPGRVRLLRRWELVPEVVWKNAPRIFVKLNIVIVLSCDFHTS
jgi:hypothetical protein